MTNDKDKATELVESVFGKPGSSPIYQTAGRLIAGLVDHITAALTTVRKEAREAAFREAFKILCPDCAEGDPPVFDSQARWYYHGELHETVGCSASKLRIEAAANTEEGGGDG